MNTVDLLKRTEETILEAAASSPEEYNNALSLFLGNLEELELQVGESVEDLEKFFWNVIKIAKTKIPVKEIEQSNGSVKSVPLYKLPMIGSRFTDRFQKILACLKKQKEAIENQEKIKELLSNQEKAEISKVKEALKNITYCGKQGTLPKSVKEIIVWLDKAKNQEKDQKMLLYRSRTPEGAAQGHNGKTWITYGFEHACENLDLPIAITNLPSFHTSEITPVFANNVFIRTDEQELIVPHSSFSLLDFESYNTREKYEKTMVLKSRASFIGTTNFSLSNSDDRALERRISYIECDETFDAKDYEEKCKEDASLTKLPTKEEIINSWSYLLTHDLKEVREYLDSSFVKNKINDTISGETVNALWHIVPAVDMLNAQRDSKMFYLGEIKELIENNSKITYTKLMSILTSFGARFIKNGNHGSRPDSDTLMDLSNFVIPETVWTYGTQNIQDRYDEVEAIFENFEPTDPDPKKQVNDEDFMNACNEILVENGEEPLTKEELEEEINNICGTVGKEEALEALDLFVNGEEEQQIKPIERSNEMVKNNTSYTDKYCTKPTNKDTDLFESINPIKQKPEDERIIEDIPEYYPRKDIYCETMRNFIFEMDDTLLEEQQALSLKNFNSKIVNRVVFSGNKSFHNRVTIDEEPESIEHYKFLWNKINDSYFLGLADTACKNPSRLTRKPGAIRNDEKTGLKPVEQKLIVSNDTVFSIPAKWNNEWEQKKLSIKMLEMMREVKHYQHIPQSVDILEELESMENRTHNEEARQLAISLVENDGCLTYDQAARAVRYIGTLGFSAEEILKQVDFEKWNFRKDYIEKLLSN